MTRDDFKILHSELIMYCQCIEFDLKRIYSGMSTGDFNDNMDMLETSNLGRTLTKLKRLDYSDGNVHIVSQKMLFATYKKEYNKIAHPRFVPSFV